LIELRRGLKAKRKRSLFVTTQVQATNGRWNLHIGRRRAEIRRFQPCFGNRPIASLWAVKRPGRAVEGCHHARWVKVELNEGTLIDIGVLQVNDTGMAFIMLGVDTLPEILKDLAP
jgi:hypothetical protein